MFAQISREDLLAAALLIQTIIVLILALEIHRAPYHGETLEEAYARVPDLKTFDPNN